MPETLPPEPAVPEYIGMAELLQGIGSVPPAVRAGDSVLGRAAAAGIGIPQLHPVVCPVPAPDPLCMGIMFAPAGRANAIPGAATTASIRKMTAHTLFRIMILSIFTIVTI
jgi:hypothetical protein